MGLHVRASWRFNAAWQATEVWDSASVSSGTGWSRYQASLADVTGEEVRISFQRRRFGDGAAINIDDVQLVCEQDDGPAGRGAQGACACDAGYSPATLSLGGAGEAGSCVPSLDTAIGADPRLATFGRLLAAAAAAGASDTVGLAVRRLGDRNRAFTVVFAPTEDAFGAMPGGELAAILGSSSTAAEIAGFHLVQDQNSPGLFGAQYMERR